MVFYRQVNVEYPDIWRVFVTGSSGAGKTTFAEKLLKTGYLKYSHLFYYAPEFHDTPPVDWEGPISYRAGCPSEDDIMTMPKYSCIVLDDIYDLCADSKVIDYLFRVYSSKRFIHCIIMSQRFYTPGRYCLSIRNCCNFICVMNNCDQKLNGRIGATFNMKKDFEKAFELQSDNLYPFIFLDMTNRARVTGIKLYLDIFSEYSKVLVNLMQYYLVPIQDVTEKQKNNRTTEKRTARIEPSAERPRVSTKDRREHFDKKVRRIIRRYNRRAELLKQA